MRRYLVLGLILACYGCGGGGGNNPPGGGGPQLLAPARYFPARTGMQYTYRLTALEFPFLPGAIEDLTYNVEANPFGAGLYFNLADVEGADDGPLFNGLRFIGLADEAAGAVRAAAGVDPEANAPEVLPAVLSGLGQTWNSDFSMLNLTNHEFHYAGTSTLAAVEDVTLGSTTFQDCLRVDVQFSQFHDRGNDGVIDFEIPLVSGSYWLAPDVGAVRGVARVSGVTVGAVQLVSAFVL
jgi:hypothetical protein